MHQAYDTAEAALTGVEPVEPSETAPSKSLADQLIDELVGPARAEGLQLTGEGGLLQQPTKRLLESTTLEGEITDDLGYDKHDPAGGTAAAHATALTDAGPVEIAVPHDREGLRRVEGLARRGRGRLAPHRRADLSGPPKTSRRNLVVTGADRGQQVGCGGSLVRQR